VGGRFTLVGVELAHGAARPSILPTELAPGAAEKGDAGMTEGRHRARPSARLGRSIDGPELPPARLDDRQSPPAAPARQRPGEKRPSTAARSDAADPPVSVSGQRPLIVFELRPIDVAFMVILQ
jgi:hypothetical protein